LKSGFSGSGSSAAAQSNALAAPIIQGVGAPNIEILERCPNSASKIEAYELHGSNYS
jgi:hypothetical protein